MIRILHVFGRMDRGGAETMIMDLYRKFDKTQIQFDFVVHTDEKCAFDDEIIELGGRIFRVPKFVGTNCFAYVNSWKKLLREHGEWKIIHAHVRSTASIFLSIARKRGLYTISHSHNVREESGFKGIVKRMLQFPIRFIADSFMACSINAGKWLFGNKSFDVLNNAIDSQNFIYNTKIREEKRKELGILPDEKIICVAARMEEQKNPVGTIEIFHEIYKRDSAYRLFWIGDGSMRKKIESKVCDLKLQNVVKFLGTRSDVSQILQAADIFLLASFYEGLPVSVIEAQASGLPCLLSDAITKETDITNLCQFLPINNPNLWVEAISKIDLNERKNTKSEIIEAGYDVVTTAKWLDEFYVKINNNANLMN